MENPIAVELVLDDKPPVETSAYVTMLPRETEAIMSDRLASELGITILDLWKEY